MLTSWREINGFMKFSLVMQVKAWFLNFLNAIDFETVPAAILFITMGGLWVEGELRLIALFVFLVFLFLHCWMLFK